ncbi:uncharacterized protein LOC117110335 [Anneissia japonica]|uniref:uncharacterized protein LOC117110335 n=1 Tax=Anneissia japonica TaxID=1529436 RepID=UPI001425A49B|nr:uncharacterized protein LOC117110335 [Anneissia japonica]
MFYKKKCYIKDEVLLKEKEREKEYSIEPSFLTSGQDMDDSEPSVTQELPSKGSMKYESHIEDICKSLRMFSQVMILHMNVISESNEQIFQLMSERVKWINIKDSITELKKQSSEDIGKMFAHVLIAVQDEGNVLMEIHELCTNDIVSSLSTECKKLNFKYNITEYFYSSKSINVSFLIHLLCSAPILRFLQLEYCDIKGVNVNEIAEALYQEGVVVELTDLNISGNNLSDIKGSSLATLLAVAPKLNDLEMRNCSISGTVMEDMFKECSSRGAVLELTNLNISGNNLNDIKGSSLATLLAVAPKLNDLYMINCSISGAVMDDMVKDCSSRGVVLQLTWLYISGNNLNDIKGSSLATLLAVAPKLSVLNMSNCSISGAVMDDIVKECSSRGVVLELKGLYISGNNLNEIKDSSLATLLAVAPKLNCLGMSNCRISCAVMDEMVKECRNQKAQKLTCSRRSIDRENYCRQRRVANTLIEEAKVAYYSTKIADSSGDQKKLFAVLDELMQKRTTPVLPTHDSDKALAVSFADFFVNKIQTIRDALTVNENPLEFALGSVDAPANRLTLLKLKLADEDEIRSIISSSPCKSSSDLDPIPTTLLKRCLHVVLPSITLIVNRSLEEGNFPDALKICHIRPLIKKPCLDREEFKNYRPASNLKFLGKTIERLVFRRSILGPDDTQIYISFKPSEKVDVNVESLKNCIFELKSWMSENFLQLNEDKTEFIIFGSPQQKKKCQDLQFNIGAFSRFCSLLLRLYKGPGYLCELLMWYVPSRTLHSGTDKLLLVEPRSTRSWGDRSFVVAAPRLWNKLPINICSYQSTALFEKALKTHLLSAAFS